MQLHCTCHPLQPQFFHANGLDSRAPPSLHVLKVVLLDIGCQCDWISLTRFMTGSQVDDPSHQMILMLYRDPFHSGFPGLRGPLCPEISFSLCTTMLPFHTHNSPCSMKSKIWLYATTSSHWSFTRHLNLVSALFHLSAHCQSLLMILMMQAL